MDPVKPNPARALSAKRAEPEASSDQAIPAELDNQVEEAISMAIQSSGLQSRQQPGDDEVIVEPYVPTGQAPAPIDDMPQAREPEMPHMHVPGQVQRPETQRRMPRADELPQPARQALGDKAKPSGEPRNARALFKRLASNVGLHLQAGEAAEPAPAAPRPADDAAARSAIEAGGTPAVQGAKGQADQHGRTSPKPAGKDHLEIPSFLRKHG